MNTLSSLRAAFLLSSCLVSLSLTAQQTAATHKQPVDYANGLVGTAPLDQQKLIGNAPPPGEQLYSGFTSPAAMLPHSSTQVGPINANLDLMHPAGVRADYFYPNRSIFGFTSGADDGPTVMPMVGDWTVPPERSSSVYDKKLEKSSPGYYSVYLDDFHTKAEMTATLWTALFRFTFPKTDRAHILLDLGDQGSDVEISDDHTVRGKVQDRDFYFVAEFSRPFQIFGTFKQHPSQGAGWPIIGFSEVDPGTKSISGHFAGAYLRFSTTEGEQILVKVATGPSYDAAQARLLAEDPGWEFDRIHQEAREAWAADLNKIEITGGTEEQKMLFYSCLYHSFDSPQMLARKGDEFVGEDKRVHTAEFDRYNQVPLWDTGRNQIVLLMMLEPGVMENILRSQLDIARETGYMGTSFHGDNADLLFLGAWQRGLDFDWASAYEYLRKNATDPKGPRGYLAEYMKQGWISDFIPDRNPSPPYAGGKAGA
ncbi:MAG: glycoside hydrolase domain-containing protein, partial [Candidatus Sulfotelmatobacter sp.]